MRDCSVKMSRSPSLHLAVLESNSTWPRVDLPNIVPPFSKAFPLPKSFVWIGTDEAGYGARLGPLTITASKWRVTLPPAANRREFSDPEFLQQADSLDWSQAWGRANDWAVNQSENSEFKALQIGDSKKVYQAGKGLLNLHRIVNSLLCCCQQIQPHVLNKHPASLSQLWTVLDSQRRSANERNLAFPYWKHPEPSSIASGRDPAIENHHTLSFLPYDIQYWQSDSIEPQKIASRMIDENAFNLGIAELGNKATLLSLETLNLVKNLISDPSDATPILVDLDRHGGRKHYLGFLQKVFEADWLHIICERPDESTYFWRNEQGREIYFRFCVKGERRFPVAISSIVSKLLRELAMQELNIFWRERLAGLHPTAGYPADAKRFYQSIAKPMKIAGLSKQVVWRNA